MSVMPAKLDGPNNHYESVPDEEPVKSLINTAELIRLGNTNKGAKEEEGQANSLSRGETASFVVEKTIPVVATAFYAPQKGQKRYARGSYERDLRLNGSGKKTASGSTPKENHTVSVDPAIISHGTKFRVKAIPDVIFTAEDKGSDVKGRRIDLYMGKGDDGLKRSIEFGRRSTTVEILRLSRK
jgi:3D (Asp-Asp-Asp) domain-containing protein